MRAYADSSFILRLATGEADSPQVIAEYRRLGAPRLLFLPLHSLEVRNAILRRAFHLRRSVASGDRSQLARERDAALARVDHLLTRGALVEVAIDLDAVMIRAGRLSVAHTERIGARAIDILDVASALALGTEPCLTTDTRQAELAKTEGMKVVLVG